METPPNDSSASESVQLAQITAVLEQHDLVANPPTWQSIGANPDSLTAKGFATLTDPDTGERVVLFTQLSRPTITEQWLGDMATVQYYTESEWLALLRGFQAGEGSNDEYVRQTRVQTALTWLTKRLFGRPGKTD